MTTLMASLIFFTSDPRDIKQRSLTVWLALHNPSSWTTNWTMLGINCRSVINLMCIHSKITSHYIGLTLQHTLIEHTSLVWKTRGDLIPQESHINLQVTSSSYVILIKQTDDPNLHKTICYELDKLHWVTQVNMRSTKFSLLYYVNNKAPRCYITMLLALIPRLGMR